jgi:hypothetical protein
MPSIVAMNVLFTMRIFFRNSKNLHLSTSALYKSDGKAMLIQNLRRGTMLYLDELSPSRHKKAQGTRKARRFPLNTKTLSRANQSQPIERLDKLQYSSNLGTKSQEHLDLCRRLSINFLEL